MFKTGLWPFQLKTSWTLRSHLCSLRTDVIELSLVCLLVKCQCDMVIQLFNWNLPFTFATQWCFFHWRYIKCNERSEHNEYSLGDKGCEVKIVVLAKENLTCLEYELRNSDPANRAFRGDMIIHVVLVIHPVYVEFTAVGCGGFGGPLVASSLSQKCLQVHHTSAVLKQNTTSLNVWRSSYG